MNVQLVERLNESRALLKSLLVRQEVVVELEEWLIIGNAQADDVPKAGVSEEMAKPYFVLSRRRLFNSQPPRDRRPKPLEGLLAEVDRRSGCRRRPRRT